MDVTEGPAEYCRQVEAYLCRKNGGHLIRIVGPAFEQVCGWAERGIPLTVAYRGVDRHCERYYAKGPRRRPVRIEFCEADVLDVFDEWRRAVGVAGLEGTVDPEGAAPVKAHGSLPAHLERTIARLTALRHGGRGALDAAIDDAVRAIDAARSGSKSLRGEARGRLLEQLAGIERSLLEAARVESSPDAIVEFEAEAERELAPFKHRMPPEAFLQSKRACVDRLLCERFRLPRVAYD